MSLSQYVCEEAVRTNLEVEDRAEAVRAILDSFVDGDALPREMVDPLLSAIMRREELGSTAIGNGVAVPHARSEDLEGILIGFAQCADGVDFKALDGEPVYQVFLVVASDEHNDEYISVMERITRLVQNDDFRRFAAAAEDTQTILALIDEMQG